MRSYDLLLHSFNRAGIDVGEFVSLYLKEGWTVKNLRDHYRVRTKTILGLTHLVTPEYTRSLRSCKRKLTKYQVIKMLLERMRYGTRTVDLARRYGVTPSSVSNICAGRQWRHVWTGVKDRFLVGKKVRADRRDE